jgi:histidine triad (HIT) family protein
MTLFERIIAREIPADIVHEDERAIAFRDINPQAPVHILIVPKKPVARVGRAGDGDEALLGHLLLVARDLAAQLGCRDEDAGFRLVINNGKDAGEAVPHLHLHLLAGRAMAWPPG